MHDGTVMSIADNREIEAASTLLGVVAAQARRDPDAPAILAPGRPALSYGALLEVMTVPCARWPTPGSDAEVASSSRCRTAPRWPWRRLPSVRGQRVH